VASAACARRCSTPNQSSNFNRIEFDIGNSCGPRVLNLASDLPSVLHPVQIDGYSQPGSARNTLPSGSDGQICIILQRGAGSSATSGLAVSSSAPETTQLQVEGLGFSNFLIAGISLPAGNGHTVLGSQFGGNIGAVNLAAQWLRRAPHLQSAGRTDRGPPSHRIAMCLSKPAKRRFRCQAGLGEYASEGLVQNNYIGLAADGTTAQPNDKGMVVYGNLHRIVDNVISRQRRCRHRHRRRPGGRQPDRRQRVRAVCDPLLSGHLRARQWFAWRAHP
jgi:hypothetical protein